MISGISTSIATQVLTQTSQATAVPRQSSAFDASVGSPASGSAGSPQERPSSRFDPTIDASNLAAKNAESPALSMMGRTLDSINTRQQSVREQMGQANHKHVAELRSKYDECTDPRERAQIESRIEDCSSMSNLIGLQQQMAEISLTMELAAKAIETGNAGIKQVSQTQT